MVRDSAEMHGKTFIDLYLPSNDNITKTVFCDHDLLFEGKKFEILISLKQRYEKNELNDFIDFYICQQLQKMIPLQKLHFFKVNNLKC